MRTLLRGKIHRATVTGADLNYEGSITIDPVLMDAASIARWELVHVLDVTNGARLETYAIPGTPDSGAIVINGAAAHLVAPGDLVIILAFETVADDAVASHRPCIVHVDGSNRIAAPGSSEPGTGLD
ncbi:MAG: aspartate 1-decarboxylase [Chloroflexi bacterium]|nr:aspartate 1-decarboxylase [Chloroflexota bacterium]MDA1002781.1 aspartate 1-decarboxylase [Chloroflexota bacterium]